MKILNTLSANSQIVITAALTKEEYEKIQTGYRDKYNVHLQDMKRCITQNGEIDVPRESTTSNNSLSAYECYKLIYGDEKISMPDFYYFEDIDKCVYNTHPNENGGDVAVVSLSSFLETLSGVDSMNNAIVICTTNFLDNLVDAVIKRPGRFDVIQEIKKPDTKQKKQLLDYYKIKFDNEKSENKFFNVMKDVSMAFVERFVVCYLTRYKSPNVDHNKMMGILNDIEEHKKLKEKYSDIGFE